MTQKDKDLLLKYLSMALPYGIKVWYKYYPTNITEEFATSIELAYNKIALSNKLNKEGDWHPIEEAKEILIKPYLRPISSMTDNELYEVQSLIGGGIEVREFYIDVAWSNTNTFSYLDIYELFNYFLEHHLDFMGLIPKNLAIEVTENNNPYK